MPAYTEFQNLQHFGRDTHTQKLYANIKEYLDWSFLQIGAYRNVNSNPDIYGNDLAELRLVDSPNFSDGQVWESAHQNWVWESGVNQATEPITPTGVVVDGTFYPSNTSGAYAHNYDYRFGRVIFDSPIPTGSTVKVNYSYKIVNITNARNIPFYQRVQYDAHRPDKGNFDEFDKGEHTSPGYVRVQLPTIAIELPTTSSKEPYEIGSRVSWVRKDVLFHVLAESETTAEKIADILDLHTAENIYMFDTNLIADNDAFNFNESGFLRSGAKTYPDLVQPSANGGYRDRQLRFIDWSTETGQWLSPDLFVNTVRTTTEVIL